MNSCLALLPHHRIALRAPRRLRTLLIDRGIHPSKCKGGLEVRFDTLSLVQSKRLIRHLIGLIKCSSCALDDVELEIGAFLYDGSGRWSLQNPFFDVLDVPLSSECVLDFLSEKQKIDERGREGYHLILYYSHEYQKQSYDLLIERAVGLKADIMSSESCVCFTLPVGFELDDALMRAGLATPPGTLFGLYQPLYDSTGFYMDNATIYQQKSIAPWAARAKACEERSLLDQQTIQANETQGTRRL